MNNIPETHHAPAGYNRVESAEMTISGFNQEIEAKVIYENDKGYQCALEETFTWNNDTELSYVVSKLTEVTKAEAADKIDFSRYRLRYWTMKVTAPAANASLAKVEFSEVTYGEFRDSYNWYVPPWTREGFSLEVQDVFQRLFSTILSRFAAPVTVERELLCTTCKGGCCSHYGHINVLEEDIPDLLEATGLTSVDELREHNVIIGTAGLGIVGQLGKAKFDPDLTENGTDTVCVFASWTRTGVNRCLIYDKRPSICRTYTEQDCDLYEKIDSDGPKLYKIRPFRKYPKEKIINPNKAEYEKQLRSHWTLEA